MQTDIFHIKILPTFIYIYIKYSWSEDSLQRTRIIPNREFIVIHTVFVLSSVHTIADLFREPQSNDVKVRRRLNGWNEFQKEKRFTVSSMTPQQKSFELRLQSQEDKATYHLRIDTDSLSIHAGLILNSTYWDALKQELHK